jgi:hypothetical protein
MSEKTATGALVQSGKAALWPGPLGGLSVKAGTGRLATACSRIVRATPVVAAAAFTLMLASPAPAANFTWSGAGAPGEDKWSNLSNWGGSAPSGSVGTLTFPPLGSPACAPTPPAATCYQATNDLAGLSVESISIDDGVGYFIRGNSITLGAGGLNASTAVTNFSRGAALRLPISLSAPQTWSINGNQGLGQLNVGTVTGPADALGVNLTNQTFLGITGDMEVGPVTVAGLAGPFLPGNVDVGIGGGGNTGSLNSGDGNPVSFKGGAGLVGFGGTIGPVSMNGGQFQVGVPGSSPGTFTVVGSLGLASTELSTFIAHPGATAGTDYSQLKVSGNVQLANARLRISGEMPSTCPALSTGEVDTLIATEGNLSGEFEGVPNGALVSVGCNAASQPKVRIKYTAHGVTATVTEPVPPPILGKRETVSVIAGVVTVRPLGTKRFVPLTGARSVPDGSEIDTTHGRVLVTAATAVPGGTSSAEAYTGRFVIHQEKTTRAETHLTLSLPLAGCQRPNVALVSPRANATTTRRRSRVRSRHLWVSEHGGSWGTNGRYVSTSVEGTQWLTIDECGRSLVVVTEGTVRIRDLIRRRTRTVSAGHRYVASVRRPSRS